VNSLDFLEAILLGSIQGATEFLPVSSSAHLALIQWKLGLDPSGPSMLLLDAMVHIATVMSVVYVFWAPARRFFAQLVADLSPAKDTRRNALRIAWLAVVACVPTAIIGLAFKDFFEASFRRPKQVAVELIISGFMLAVLALVPRGRRGWREFRWWQAGLVGVAQGVSILPGISRSGATICVAEYFGLRRQWAAEFSFLIAIPAILGAVLIKAKDTLDLPADELAALPWGPLLAGSVAAWVVGTMALRLLVAAVRRAKLHYFAWYCWALGLTVLLNS
jgi:undecaprenyl-diphosphatase